MKYWTINNNEIKLIKGAIIDSFDWKQWKSVEWFIIKKKSFPFVASWLFVSSKWDSLEASSNANENPFLSRKRKTKPKEEMTESINYYYYYHILLYIIIFHNRSNNNNSFLKLLWMFQHFIFIHSFYLSPYENKMNFRFQLFQHVWATIELSHKQKPKLLEDISMCWLQIFHVLPCSVGMIVASQQ